ncbi:uncharacterized protein LOC115215478 [Octopus sinensis]|uniref:Uncharacterized protein LOC115215478 n=1 Tax=Octopus sinensis TaxID=2607531 RepID=A0A6P7SQ55_9MOLL|nr:uncharacterized protein LOC115215478 [Octopus sinensis]XP_036362058.1 uncharacterized protein LOC115215478 [Octopus sinensis]XP_036362059.1 uncharacterized protein LOC115215478 [Octopus sinensis]XP_036362060.1 uncharacterized protein LOC115215478 [Octopus sinensis]
MEDDNNQTLYSMKDSTVTNQAQQIKEQPNTNTSQPFEVHNEFPSAISKENDKHKQQHSNMDKPNECCGERMENIRLTSKPEDIYSECKNLESNVDESNNLHFSSNDKLSSKRNGFKLSTKAEVHISDVKPEIRQCEKPDSFDGKNCTDMSYKAQCEMKQTYGLGSDCENLSEDRKIDCSYVPSKHLNIKNITSELKSCVEGTLTGGENATENNVDTMVCKSDSVSEISGGLNDVGNCITTETDKLCAVSDGNVSLEINNDSRDACRKIGSNINRIGTDSSGDITPELDKANIDASKIIGPEINKDSTNADGNLVPEFDCGIVITDRNIGRETEQMDTVSGGSIPSEANKEDSILSTNTDSEAAGRKETVASGNASTGIYRKDTIDGGNDSIEEGTESSVINENITSNNIQETFTDANILHPENYSISNFHKEEPYISNKTEQTNLIDTEILSSKSETSENSIDDDNLEIKDDNSNMIEYTLEENIDAVIPSVKLPEAMVSSLDLQTSSKLATEQNPNLSSVGLANTYQTDTHSGLETNIPDSEKELKTENNLKTLRPIIHSYVVNETGVRAKRTNSIEIKTVTFSQDTIFNEDKSKQYRKEKISFRTVYKSCTTDSETYSKINPLFEDDSETGNVAMCCALGERRNSLVYLGDDENSLSGDSEDDAGVEISVLNFPSYMEKYLQKDDNSVTGNSRVKDYSTHSNITTITNTWNKRTLMEANILSHSPQDFIASLPPLDITGYRIFVKKKQKQERYHFIMKIAFIILFLLTIVTIVMIILYFEVIKR